MAKRFVLVLLAIVPLMGHAQTHAEALSKCLTENTSGKDRKELARWIFLSMSAHPDMERYTSASARSATSESHKAVAAMFMHLLTETCPNELRAAINEGNAAGIQAAFQTLGQLAWQELMMDKAVVESMAEFQKQLDQKRINAVVAGP